MALSAQVIRTGICASLLRKIMKQLSRVLFMLTALVVTTTVPAQQVNPPLWQQAKKGDVSAQYSLSAILARGKSYIQSNYWLTQAAQRGDPRAQMDLALRYRNGLGTDRTGRLRADDTQLFYWAQKAAMADVGGAQYIVSNLYEHGQGIPQNSVYAAAWLLLAADKEQPGSLVAIRVSALIAGLDDRQTKEAWRLYRHLSNRIKVSVKTRERQLARNIPVSEPEPKVNFHNQLALAEKGDASAMVKLGLIYGNGVAVKQNYAEALKWFSKAADKGNAEAQYYLAFAWERGVGVEPDESKAERYYQLAAKGGEKFALNYMGMQYREGKRVAKDLPRACGYFKRAAYKGVAIAQKRLAECYLKGIHGREDRRKAYLWYSLASAFGEYGALSQRSMLAQTLSATELVQAQNEAQRLFEQIFKIRAKK
ncbi:tetratricopeptide repeat protein [Klebsiella aerogenes]|uniref:tetratricopeptide repeat protein n=2 Tax=Klebsiella aerogenes TaxID=548 RepID=UPI002811A457|nr:tetratricopeptide repeat protein [Klebsiella aerogenes]EIV2083970.1 sel1 repeat family protein [Klebsiella aerogenes]EIW9212211.1 sel1 repeat family protein [Klebsiella aerogenes]